MARIEADLTINHGRALVSLNGGVDISNAHRLGALLRKLVTEGCTDVVIDLSDVSRVDASGIGILRGAAAALNRESGGTLRYRNARSDIAEILRVNGLEAIDQQPGRQPEGQPEAKPAGRTPPPKPSRESQPPSLRRPERTTRSRVPRP